MIYGSIFDSSTSMPLKNTMVTLFNIRNEKVVDIFPSDDGSFSLDINYEEDIYKIITFKEGYHFTYNLLYNTTMTVHMVLKIPLRKRN